MSVEGPTAQPVARNPYEQILAQTQQQHHLLSVHWELTYRCNQRCAHCYLEVLPPQATVPGELSTAECLRVVDELAALGVLNLTFSGGEPLVRRDFIEIAEYARANRFLLRVFTNGLRITPAVADRLAALHPYAVEISLYSVHPKLHDRITRLPRAWELTTRALALLHARGVRTILKTPLMHETVRELHALEDLARELGAQFQYDITLTPRDDGGRAPLEHRLTDDDLRWLFHETLSPEAWLARRVTDDTPVCGIGTNALLLDPYGNVFPCVQVRTLAGNVREQRMEEIWRSSPLWKELGQLALHDLPVCRTCELSAFCVRCHGLAQLEEGDLRAPAWVNCREAWARRQVLIEKGALSADNRLPMHFQWGRAESLALASGDDRGLVPGTFF